MSAAGALPAGYEAARVRGAQIVALAEAMPVIREIVTRATLHDFAAAHPDAVALAGRGTAYAIPLPVDDLRVVVRRSRHGGTFASVTGDLFLLPRAAAELTIATRLAELGVPTPEIVAYVLYRAGIFRRSDVATREVERARDLAAAIIAAPDAAAKRILLDATARLLGQLARAGARHPDLNLKNVLLAPGPTSRVQAWVLDVDRVVFGEPGDARIMTANLQRLERSARKWRDQHDAPIDEADLGYLRTAVEREQAKPMVKPGVREAR